MEAEKLAAEEAAALELQRCQLLFHEPASRFMSEANELRSLLAALHTSLRTHSQKIFDKEEWAYYTSCDELPSPRDLKGLNAYLALWAGDIETLRNSGATAYDSEEIVKRFQQTGRLCEEIALASDEDTVRCAHASELGSKCDDIRAAMRATLDQATFHILQVRGLL